MLSKPRVRLQPINSFKSPGDKDIRKVNQSVIRPIKLEVKPSKFLTLKPETKVS